MEGVAVDDGYEPIQRSQHQPNVLYNRYGIRSGWRLACWLALSVVLSVIPLIALGIALLVSDPDLLKGGSKHLDPSSLPPWFALSASGCIFPALFGAAMIVAVFLEKRPTRSLGLGFYRGWSRDLAAGLAWGSVALSALVLMLAAPGCFRFEGLNESGFSALGWALGMGLGFLGLALTEEFLSRGYLFQNLLKGLGLWPAAIISCLFFTLPHLRNTGENLIGILDVLAAGVMLLVLVYRTRSLWMAVGYHAAWDWCQSYLFGVPDSGIVIHGFLLKTRIQGPTWLSGGTAGPEGSILGIILELSLALLFLRAPWLRPRPEAAALWDRYVERKPPVPAPPGSPEPAPPFDLSASSTGEPGKERAKAPEFDLSASSATPASSAADPGHGTSEP